MMTPAETIMTIDEAVAITGRAIEALKRLQAENAELKRLLKLAVGDIQHMSCVENICDVCVNDPHLCTICDTCIFTWEHYDEAKGLIEIA